MHFSQKTQIQICLFLVAVTTFFLTACGLSERERHVAETNSQIEEVRQQSLALARAIYVLPDRPTGPESFVDVISTYHEYRTEVDRLNVLIHSLGEVSPEITDHLREIFDREVDAAVSGGDESVTLFDLAGATVDDYQEALTMLCLSVERYAEAVTAVSQEYNRLAG